MLITFHENGRVEFTRSPKLLALFPDEQKRIVRMTEIVFHEELQRYFVFFLQGPSHWRESALGILSELYDMFAHEYGGFEDKFQIHTELGGLITFDSYEAAVRAEVRFVEFLRDLGYSMAA